MSNSKIIPAKEAARIIREGKNRDFEDQVDRMVSRVIEELVNLRYTESHFGEELSDPDSSLKGHDEWIAAAKKKLEELGYAVRVAEVKEVHPEREYRTPTRNAFGFIKDSGGWYDTGKTYTTYRYNYFASIPEDIEDETT